MARIAQRAPIVSLFLFLAVANPVRSAGDNPVLWPDFERQFLLDGPAFLLPEETRRELSTLDPRARRDAMEAFLGTDPIPETEVNELAGAIEVRRDLALSEANTFLDDRARVLFLNGKPSERREVECGATFVPMEVWTYSIGTVARRLLFYERAPGQPFRLWLPLDSKRALYTSEMEYWLEQYEELRSRIRSKRFDLLTCSETRLIDDVTGVKGLTGYQAGRPTAEQLRPFLNPPEDLGEWSRQALGEAPSEPRTSLAVEEVKVLFPERFQQRLIARVLLTLPAGVTLGVVTDAEQAEHRLAIEGLLEEGGEVFEQFRVRYVLSSVEGDKPLALALERRLRPGREYLMRLEVIDEVEERWARVSVGFKVPLIPTSVDEPAVPEGVVVALGEQLAKKRLPGMDSLLLVPPERDIVLGVWRAETLISGESIQKVVFLVDGEEQLTRTRPPFSAEVRLALYPTEQVIRAEGYDASGLLVAADEVVVNQPRGAFRVRILEPVRGAAVGSSVKVRAEVVVPDERRVERVEFFLNETLEASLDTVPWQTTLEISGAGDVSYLTVVAMLDDGSRSEQVRFLNAPEYLEEVDVNLVEVLTTVLDRSNRPVKGLVREEFKVSENGRPQSIEKFELVEDLPLTVGFAIDTSGSMEMALPEARKAAVGFLDNMITSRDRVFALGFAGEPVLLMPPTDDVRAVEEALGNLRSIGWTALHDALVHSLYYFRAARGRKALILLSDGDDSASYYPFRDALEYARRSGVVIYTVGVGVSGLKTGIRRKLNQLAEETGGRAFFIDRANELVEVYDSIEDELRSQYLLTYSSDGEGGNEEFRTIEIEVRDGKLEARAPRGYYPL